MTTLIAALAPVSATLTKLRRPGRSLTQWGSRRAGLLDRPGTGERPHRSPQRRLGTPPQLALRFRSLTNYFARFLLEIGGLRLDHTVICDERLWDGTLGFRAGHRSASRGVRM
jgi:hypothetical protein